MVNVNQQIERTKQSNEITNKTDRKTYRHKSGTVLCLLPFNTIDILLKHLTDYMLSNNTV